MSMRDGLQAGKGLLSKSGKGRDTAGSVLLGASRRSGGTGGSEYLPSADQSSVPAVAPAVGGGATPDGSSPGASPPGQDPDSDADSEEEGQGGSGAKNDAAGIMAAKKDSRWQTYVDPLWQQAYALYSFERSRLQTVVAASYLFLAYVIVSAGLHSVHVHLSVRGHVLGGFISSIEFDEEGQEGALLGEWGKLSLVLVQVLRVLLVLGLCAALSTWHREVLGPYQTGYNIPQVSSLEMQAARGQAREELDQQMEEERAREQARFMHAAYQVALHENEAGVQIVRQVEQQSSLKGSPPQGGGGLHRGLGPAGGSGVAPPTEANPTPSHGIHDMLARNSEGELAATGLLPPGADGRWDEHSEEATRVPFEPVVAAMGAPLRAIEHDVKAGTQMYAKPVPRLEEVSQARARLEDKHRDKKDNRPREQEGSLASRLCFVVCCRYALCRRVCCCCCCSDCSDGDGVASLAVSQSLPSSNRSTSGRDPKASPRAFTVDG